MNSVAHHHFGVAFSVGAGRNGGSRSRKGKTCQVRASRQSPLPPVLTALTRCKVRRFPTNSMNIVGFYRPTDNHAFNSYFHTIGYYRLILCRFHPLADKVHVLCSQGLQCTVVVLVLELCKPRLCTTSNVFRGTSTVSMRFLPSMVAG